VALSCRAAGAGRRGEASRTNQGWHECQLCLQRSPCPLVPPAVLIPGGLGPQSLPFARDLLPEKLVWLSPAGAWEKPCSQMEASLPVISSVEKSQVTALKIFNESKIRYRARDWRG